MGTPETTFNFTNNREARNAIFAAIALASIAFLGLSNLVAPALNGQTLSLFTIIEIIIISEQILSIILSAVQIFQGKVNLGVWWLIFSFIVTSIARTLLRESIGLPIGALTAILVSAIGYLCLPPQKASQANILGYGVGALMIIFDLYAGNIYAREITPPSLVTASINLSIFVFVIQVIVLLTQARSLSLATKISNYFSVFILITVVIIGLSSIQILSAWVVNGNDANGVAAILASLKRGTIAAGAVLSFAGAIVGVIIAGLLTKPLNLLSETSARVAAGDLDARANVNTEDEIGALADTFNGVTISLKDMVGKLEEKVNERTRDLERRALQIRTAVEIGHAATSLRDLESLLTHTTRLISERFGFYHAGIFLLDEANEYAVLHAANSKGGQTMLSRGHRLKIGETGIVGFVTQTGKARIALDVGADAIYFDNPDLPDTRSEMALPLVVSGQILGALDVQSAEPQAFREEDIDTLQILADQLAIAIENANLFAENQEALESARIVYGEVTRNAWIKIIKNEPRIGYMAGATGAVQQLHDAPTTDTLKTIESGDLITASDGMTIGVPVLIRGKAVGALRLKKTDKAEPWSEDETALAIALSEQLSGALESARLYKESLQRAARESLVSDISARISALPRVDTIVRETVLELGEAIGDASVTFQLLEMPDTAEQAGSPGNGSGNSSIPNKKQATS